jgi:ferredoxin
MESNDMTQKSVIFHFPAELYDKPIIGRLMRDFSIDVNILQAQIMPQEAGYMFAIIEGSDDETDRALHYMNDLGVEIVLPVRNLVWDEDLCVHCGACVGPCRPKAFTVDPETALVSFDSARCIACNLCIPACGYGAIESIKYYLKQKGETNGQEL